MFCHVAQVILYSFYKNIALVMTLFFFGFFSAHSGTTLFESWIGAGWNVGWTFLPILALGVHDEDISRAAVLKCPAVYKSGQNNSCFSPSKLFQVGNICCCLLVCMLFNIHVFDFVYSGPATEFCIL